MPDILTLAKPLGGGLPMGAILLARSLAGALKVGDHGSDVRRQPGGAAAALAVLDHLAAPGFLDDVASAGALPDARASRSSPGKHKGPIAEVRGLGLMIGVEFTGEAAPGAEGPQGAGHPGRQGRREGAALAAAARRERGEIRQLLAALDEVLAAGARAVGGLTGRGFEIDRRRDDDEQREEGRAGVLGGARHLDHHPLAEGELRRRRGHRLLRRRRARATTTRRCGAKALATGASKCIVEDLREEFVRDYGFKALAAGAVYEDRYLLGTALARPLLAYHQVQVALAEGADALAHGATGKGNDQVRFEVTYGAFAPHLRVIAPWREWTIRSREDALAYARHARRARGPDAEGPLQPRRQPLAPLPRGRQPRGHLGRPPEGDVQADRRPARRAGQGRSSSRSRFERGRAGGARRRAPRPGGPGRDAQPRGGRPRRGPRSTSSRTGWSGIKSRGVYETPAGTVLHIAHRELERLVLDRDTLHFKQSVSVRYAQLIYDGLWFSTLREALAAFVDETEQEVTGEVRVRLYKGTRRGRRPPLAAQPLPPGPRHVRRGHGLRPQGRRGLHPPVRPARSACGR